MICFPIGTKTFLHLSWGGSGPSRWPPLFERRVGGGLPLPLALVTSFSILLLMSFGLRSPYGSCALVGSPFSTTVGCRWCLALAPSRWDSCLSPRLLFAPCGCQCVSWWSSLRPRVLGVLGSLQCASLSGVRHLSRVCSSVWGPFGVAHSFSVKSLSAFAEGLTDTLLLCPVRALRLSLRRSRYRSRLHCRPSRAVSSLTVSIFCEWSLLRQGRLPMHWVPSEPMGFAVAPPISPYTGPGQSPRLDVSPLGLRSVFTALA